MITEENSLSKIIDYIDASNSESIVISHLIHRDIGGCFEHCGGCCKRVTLDYFEGTERWESFKKLFPEKIKDFERSELGTLVIYSNRQLKNQTGFCQYLNLENGLCHIHEARPMMCQSTPLKFKGDSRRSRVFLTSETYGRRHAFKRIDGEKGAKCKMLSITEKRKSEDLVFLEELKFIADRLLIPHHLDVILNTLQNRSENSESIILNFKK